MYIYIYIYIHILYIYVYIHTHMYVYDLCFSCFNGSNNNMLPAAVAQRGSEADARRIDVLDLPVFILRRLHCAIIM